MSNAPISAAELDRMEAIRAAADEISEHKEWQISYPDAQVIFGAPDEPYTIAWVMECGEWLEHIATFDPPTCARLLAAARANVEREAMRCEWTENKGWFATYNTSCGQKQVCAVRDMHASVSINYCFNCGLPLRVRVVASEGESE